MRSPLATPEARSDMEGITLLYLSQPSEQMPPIPPQQPDRSERSEEAAAEEPATADAPSPWDWSYDPLVPLQAGRPEPILDGARLPDDLLRASISWRSIGGQGDSLRIRLDHYAYLQSSFALRHRHLWDAQARAQWLERHELWLKLYGSFDDWP